MTASTRRVTAETRRARRKCEVVHHGAQFDVMQWGSEPFTEALRHAYADGKPPKKRLSDMVRRILHSIYAVGLDELRKHLPATELDFDPGQTPAEADLLAKRLMWSSPSGSDPRARAVRWRCRGA